MNDRDSGSGSGSPNTADGFKTFLLVDDEQAILDWTSPLLEAQGNRVFAVASVAAALQVMEQKSDEIDFLIIDHSMPETNGLQLMNQFRSIGLVHPTILCSGLTMDIREHPDAQYWPEHVLAKPYDFRRLQDAISFVMETRDCA